MSTPVKTKLDPNWKAPTVDKGVPPQGYYTRVSQWHHFIETLAVGDSFVVTEQKDAGTCKNAAKRLGIVTLIKMLPDKKSWRVWIMERGEAPLKPVKRPSNVVKMGR